MEMKWIVCFKKLTYPIKGKTFGVYKRSVNLKNCLLASGQLHNKNI